MPPELLVMTPPEQNGVQEEFMVMVPPELLMMPPVAICNVIPKLIVRVSPALSVSVPDIVHVLVDESHEGFEPAGNARHDA